MATTLFRPSLPLGLTFPGTRSSNGGRVFRRKEVTPGDYDDPKLAKLSLSLRNQQEMRLLYKRCHPVDFGDKFHLKRLNCSIRKLTCARIREEYHFEHRLQTYPEILIFIDCTY
ncbi:hypothetical protein AVEN_197014-1 [Araneus ventricosus]|uniref:Uncharacterized protein n=1 Tax=Araneus ventricosus TaxID=182803 RepID=A0A4Y2ED33_ARAVE|nr:hypothetical protein AVEN_197014-1 [Araneus ventricosus]